MTPFVSKQLGYWYSSDTDKGFLDKAPGLAGPLGLRGGNQYDGTMSSGKTYYLWKSPTGSEWEMADYNTSNSGNSTVTKTVTFEGLTPGMAYSRYIGVYKPTSSTAVKTSRGGSSITGWTWLMTATCEDGSATMGTGASSDDRNTVELYTDSGSSTWKGNSSVYIHFIANSSTVNITCTSKTYNSRTLDDANLAPLYTSAYVPGGTNSGCMFGSQESYGSSTRTNNIGQDVYIKGVYDGSSIKFTTTTDSTEKGILGKFRFDFNKNIYHLVL